MSLESLCERSVLATSLDEVYEKRLIEFYRSHLHEKIEGIYSEVRIKALQIALFNHANLRDIIIQSNPHSFRRGKSHSDSYLAFPINEISFRFTVMAHGGIVLKMLRLKDCTILFYSDFTKRVDRLLTLLDEEKLDSILHVNEKDIIHDLCKENPELLGDEGSWSYNATMEKLNAWLEEYNKDKAVQKRLQRESEQNQRELENVLQNILNQVNTQEEHAEKSINLNYGDLPEALWPLFALDLPPYLLDVKHFKDA